MCDLDVNGNAINWRAVPGKYEREFVQQCSADIDWNIARSMQQDYEQARKAAREGKQDKSFYNKAVFATDKNLQRYDYPINQDITLIRRVHIHLKLQLLLTKITKMIQKSTKSL